MKNIFEDKDTDKLSTIPKLIFESLLTFYKLDLDTAVFSYKAIFYSYCKSYNNDFSMIFKFFLLLLEHLRLVTHEDTRISNSLEFVNAESEKFQDLAILKELLSVLTTTKNTLNCSVKDITFTDTLRKITITTLQLTDKSCMNDTLKILSNIVAVDPLVIEPIISEILVLIMLSDHSEHQLCYDQLMVSVFEVFAKLHRIQSLISKMVPALKAGLDGTFKSDNLTYDFQSINDKESALRIEDILSKPVLSYFADCITTLASWQVMNLFKTFMFHLNAALETIGKGM